MSEYELVKKLGSYDNFKGLKSMAKVPRHKLFARNKLSAPTVLAVICLGLKIILSKEFFPPGLAVMRAFDFIRTVTQCSLI
jgi:hypothetical protein